MITVAIAASAASRMMPSPGIAPATRPIHAGGACPSITWSRTILSGQGAARLIAVSTPVASRMTTSHPRYGRSRPAIKGPMPVERVSRSALAAIVDSTVCDTLQSKARRKIEGGALVRPHDGRIHGRGEDGAGSGGVDRQPQPPAGAVVPLRRALAGDEDPARVAERRQTVTERQEDCRLSQRDAQLGVPDDRGISREPVQIVAAKHAAAEHRVGIEPGDERRAADERRVEERIAAPVPLARDAEIEEQVGQDVPSQERRRLAAELGERAVVVEQGGRVAHLREELEAALRGERPGTGVECETGLDAGESKAASAVRSQDRDDVLGPGMWSAGRLSADSTERPPGARSGPRSGTSTRPFATNRRWWTS